MPIYRTTLVNIFHRHLHLTGIHLILQRRDMRVKRTKRTRFKKRPRSPSPSILQMESTRQVEQELEVANNQTCPPKKRPGNPTPPLGPPSPRATHPRARRWQPPSPKLKSQMCSLTTTVTIFKTSSKMCRSTPKCSSSPIWKTGASPLRMKTRRVKSGPPLQNPIEQRGL